MANSYFKFKQFTIRQEGAAMKVGTDGVLLGAWADVFNTKSILDVGTGSGIIALMLAQRSKALIDAVEIDIDSANQAKSNFFSSPWQERLNIINSSFQDFYVNNETKYDLVVSNPPYFSNSLKSQSEKRTLTRHTDGLPNDQLLEGVVKLLNPGGRFCAIFPYSEGNVFIAQASNYGLYCNKKINIHSLPDKPVLRLLLEFSFSKKRLIENELSIHNANDSYSEDYKKLTGNFYIAF